MVLKMMKILSPGLTAVNAYVFGYPSSGEFLPFQLLQHLAFNLDQLGYRAGEGFHCRIIEGVEGRLERCVINF